MSYKKFGALILTLIAGLLIVSVVGAQDATPEPLTPPMRGAMRGHAQNGMLGRMGGYAQNGMLGQMGGNGLLGELVGIISDDLDMQPSDIVQQLRDGQTTLAELIEANGGSVDDVTAQLSAAITDRVNEAVANGNLTQDRADLIFANLDQHIQDVLNGEYRAMLQGAMGPQFGGQLGGRALRGGMFFDHFGARAPLMDAVMDATGLNGRDLAQALQDGSTLSDVITANGADPAAVVADAIATVTERLDEAVANGNLTEDQKTQILEGVQAFYDAALTATRPAAAMSL